MRDQATTDVMQHRLIAWAAWLTTAGNGAGYPTKSVLHDSWLPPSPGQVITMRACAAGNNHQERRIDTAIRQLSGRLQDTLAVVYLMRAKPAEQAQRLDCQDSTVRARVAQAKQQLSLMLDACN